MIEMIEDTKFVEVYELGEKLLREFGLHDWTFDLVNRKTFLGVCQHRKRRIVFSSYFLHIPLVEIEDTIRHEIAHALVGADHGHDDVWKDMAISCGARPERLAPPHIKTSAQYKYLLKCPECGNTWHRHRLKKKVANGARCPDCHVKIDIYYA